MMFIAYAAFAMFVSRVLYSAFREHCKRNQTSQFSTLLNVLKTLVLVAVAFGVIVIFLGWVLWTISTPHALPGR